MANIITRREAQAAGLRRYFTGKPCAKGHVTERYVTAKRCVECTNAEAIRRWKADPDAHKWRTYRWQRSNPDKTAACQGLRLARERGAVVPPAYSTKLCVPFYAEARRRTRITGIPHEVDHIIPISKGGQHVHTNLQVLTKMENQMKGDRL